MLEKPAITAEPINEYAAKRWSPIAYDDNRPVAKADLISILEAGRWAASCFNEQPWRFIVGSKTDDKPTWDKIYTVLIEGNQRWVAHAPILLLAIAKKNFTYNGEPNRFAQHDVGQAMANMAIETVRHDLWMHQMAGYDQQKARDTFAIGDDYEVMAIATIGYMADAMSLDDVKLRERQENPLRQRKALTEIVFGSTLGEPSVLIAD